jgi:hypothetical protein
MGERRGGSPAIQIEAHFPHRPCSDSASYAEIDAREGGASLGVTDAIDPVMKSLTKAIGCALLVALGAASALAMTGCASVAPYERGTLAHPTMSTEDPYTSGLDEHVRAVSEGASGGLNGGGGGCGCN